MKKMLASFLSFFTVIMIFSLNAAAQTEYEEIKTDTPPEILFLGDSIATGYGLDGYKSGKENCESYANILAYKYANQLKGKCKTAMKNSAIDGQTSGELLSGLNNGVYDEDLRNSDAVIISIGGNDLLTVLWDFVSDNFNINFNDSYTENQENNLNFTQIIQSITSLGSKIDSNLKSFDSNLAQIAKYIKNKSNGILIIQTLYNPFDQLGQEQIKEFIADKIKALNSSIEAHKNDSEANYIVADVYSEFYGKGNELTRISNMDIHPNQQGHKVIAQCVDKTIGTEKYTYLIEKPDTAVQSNNIKKNSNQKVIFAALVCIGIIVVIISVIGILKVKSRKQGE